MVKDKAKAYFAKLSEVRAPPPLCALWFLVSHVVAEQPRESAPTRCTTLFLLAGFVPLFPKNGNTARFFRVRSTSACCCSCGLCGGENYI